MLRRPRTRAAAPRDTFGHLTHSAPFVAKILLLMTRLTFTRIVVASCSLIVSACGRGAATPGKPSTADTETSAAAPAFTVATLGGDSATVGGTKRQPVTLVNIWATWCGPCKKEFPELQALHTAYASRGLRVMAISIDSDGDADVLSSAKSMGATFTIGRDPADQVRGLVSAVGIPESWLVTADGKLVWRHSGAIPNGDASVRAAIESALSSGGGQ